MRRISEFSGVFHRSELLFHRAKPSRTSLKPYPENPTRIIPTRNGFRFVRPICDQPISLHPPITSFKCLIPMFFNPRNDKIQKKVSSLKDDILAFNGDSQGVISVLDDKGLQIFRLYPDGSAFVELLEQLQPWPSLVFMVLEWRINMNDPSLRMTAEEYSKGITVAGKAKNVKLATELFHNADKNRIRTASTYNALMSAYMINGKSKKCESLFQIFKKEAYCSPTIVTYNMLISSYGRQTLVPHMEAALEGLKTSYLAPNLKTYNDLIAGYVVDAKWDDMEGTYLDMKANSVQPDTNTYSLMLRGYSHSCNLEKMEEMYEFVKQNDGDLVKDINTVIVMICGYCKSSDKNKIRKIEELRKLIPKDFYRPWLNVLLIKVYAQAGLVDKMEELINEAFEHQTLVVTPIVMRAIITAFFHHNEVDKLAKFVSRAEYAGWRICKSLYHCKMVMYASQNRLIEMERVLSEMDRLNLSRTRKTLMILYKAYKQWGPGYRLYEIKGLMCKQGYDISLDECPS